jgi:hypothetical protein
MVAELKGGGLAWGINMSVDAPSNEMVAFLLGVLENVENSAGKDPISTLRKPADVQDEAKSNSVSTTEDRGANRFAEQVVAAMSKLRDPNPHFT